MKPKRQFSPLVWVSHLAEDSKTHLSFVFCVKIILMSLKENVIIPISEWDVGTHLSTIAKEPMAKARSLIVDEWSQLTTPPPYHHPYPRFSLQSILGAELQLKPSAFVFALCAGSTTLKQVLAQLHKEKPGCWCGFSLIALELPALSWVQSSHWVALAGGPAHALLLVNCEWL